MALVPSRRLAPPPVDVAIGLGVAVLDVVGALIGQDGDPGGPDLTPAGAALLVAAGVVLIWRRRWPFATSIVVGGLIITYGVAELPDPPIYVAMVVSLATVAAYATRAQTIGVFGVFVGSTVVAVVLSADSGPDDLYALGVPAVAALVLGAAYRERLDAVARARRGEVDAAIGAERQRIARELHDVVAHHVSVMVVQAEAGAAAAEVRGDTVAAAAFDGIAATGRQAMGELRRLLDVLRDDTATGIEPRPGTAQVPALVAGVREAGVPVDLVVEGEARALADGIDVSAYRIVQEALTNVVRHAGAVPTRVRLSWEADALALAVEDDGPAGRAPSADATAGGADAGAGRGLVGIRERVALLDGVLEVGPRPEGGFAVRARLPLEGGRR